MQDLSPKLAKIFLRFKLAIIILFSIGLFQNAYSQSSGFVIPTPEEFNSFALKEPYFGGELRPPPLQDSIAKFFPNPGHQGNQYACMGFAFAHGMTTALEAIETERIPEEYSAAYLYNATKQQEPKGDCNYGVRIGPVKALLETHGVPLDKEYSFKSGQCDITTSEVDISFSRRRKLKNITRINGTGTDNDIVLRVRDAISAFKQPVVIGMPTGPNFKDYRSGIYPTDFQTKFDKDIQFENVPQENYHVMVIVGYDSTRGFKVLNSYGMGWGDLGFSWIDEELVGRKDVWLWTAELGELVKGEETTLRPAGSIKTTTPQVSNGDPAFGAPSRSTVETNSSTGEYLYLPAESQNVAVRATVNKEKYEFGQKIANSIKGTVGHVAAGQTPKGLDYYPVSMWLQLPKDELNKIAKVEYHWDAPSYRSPKTPKGGAKTAFMIQYYGYGAVNQARIRIWLNDGTEYEIFYPFKRIWNFGYLREKDRESIIIKVNPEPMPSCPLGSSRKNRGPCISDDL